MEQRREDEEPLIDGLTSLPPSGFELPRPAEGFQEALFASTARVIRTRSRWRRARVVAALLAFYAAGFGTSQIVDVRTVEAPAAITIETNYVGLAPVPSSTDPAATLRQVRSAAPADRPRLLKQAGDEYLTSSGDLEGALHCYRQLLELSRPEEKTKPEPGDTWLLAALKTGQSATQER